MMVVDYVSPGHKEVLFCSPDSWLVAVNEQ
jgi:hypothetical protein